jgi:hypothetical protein
VISAILDIFSVFCGLIGILVAAKGTSKTQSILLRGQQRDMVIDALAWVDRHVLRANSGR